MNFYTSSSTSDTANNETNNPLSSFSPSILIRQHPVSVQGEFNLPMGHAPPHNVMPTSPQGHVVRTNAPLFPQPSIYVYQQHHGRFSVPLRGGAVPEFQILRQNLASAAVSHRQIAHVNTSMPPQPPHHVYQDISPVQGDPSPPHAHSNAASPIQPETPDDKRRYACPHCKRKFKRNPELTRHLKSNLPDSIHCPVPRCPWTGRRQYILVKHMKVHRNLDPGREYERKDYQIYDPEELVQSMASGNLTVRRAADIALSKVKKRFEDQDKANVEARVWGSRRKFCTARSRS